MRFWVGLFSIFLSFSCLSSDKELGKITYLEDIPGEWSVVVAENDTFVFSKDGRFSISAHGDELKFTDIWRQQAITPKELVERYAQYPVTDVLEKIGYRPIQMGSPDVESKVFVFLILGMPDSEAFFKESRSLLASMSASLIVMPGSDHQRYYSFRCAPPDWQMEMLSGVNLEFDYSECNEAVLNKSGVEALALAKMLRVTRAPFAVISDSGKGQIVNSSVFKSMVLANEK